jgi:hypothetical protein
MECPAVKPLLCSQKIGYQPGRVVSAIVIKEDTDLDVPAGVSGVVLGNERRSTNHTAAI